MTLGERLKKLRESNSLAQRQVGSLIDVDGAFISKVEHNEKRISRDHLNTLAKHFNIDPKELHVLWLVDKISMILQNENENVTSRTIDSLKNRYL